MKKFIKWFTGIILVRTFGYPVGPKPPKPVFNAYSPELLSSLIQLEREIDYNENAIPGIKPDNGARIARADTLKKGNTKWD